MKTTEILKELIDNKKKTVFIKEYQEKATDAETLGLLISQYFQWDGLEILKTLYNALEDANFHTENEIVVDMIERVENKINA